MKETVGHQREKENERTEAKEELGLCSAIL